ncbi:MAG: hypothetical protein WBH11_16405 [Stenotrophomonas geniculata]
MMRVRLPVTLLGLLLQMMASCTSPPARYQPATVQDRSGVPCFGVPDSSETRAHPPRITGVSVMEVGSGGTPIWERDSLREGVAEPALQPGKRYQVEMWGHAEGRGGKAQSRWFNAFFCLQAGTGTTRAIAVAPGADGRPHWEACVAR